MQTIKLIARLDAASKKRRDARKEAINAIRRVVKQADPGGWCLKDREIAQAKLQKIFKSEELVKKLMHKAWGGYMGDFSDSSLVDILELLPEEV